MEGTLWAAYVARITRGERQVDVASKVGVDQGTISRWVRGLEVPDRAARVAILARSYERNVLEAFIAAGMLEESEAGRGLPKKSRDFLAQLRDGREDAIQAAADAGLAEGLGNDSGNPRTPTRRRAVTSPRPAS